MLTMAYAEMHTATFHINVLCFCDVSTSVGRFFCTLTAVRSRNYNIDADTCTACAARFNQIFHNELSIYIRICI